MIFKIQMLVMVEIMALVGSTFLLMFAHKQECCQKFYKIIAYFGILATFATIICTGYHVCKYAKAGFFKMHNSMMMETEGMGKHCGGMGGMMGGMRHPYGAESTPSHPDSPH